MRFHVGPIPEDETFKPVEDGWESLREPGAYLAQSLALPIGFAAAALAYSLISRVTPIVLSLADLMSPAVLITLGLVIAVHEIVHAALHPLSGRSPATILGIWPSHLMFYSHYDGAISRNRLLLMSAGPFIVLSIGPTLLSAAFGLKWWGWAAVSILNAVGSGADLLGLALVALQVPRAAIVRNKGYRTYWRVGSTGGLRPLCNS